MSGRLQQDPSIGAPEWAQIRHLPHIVACSLDWGQDFAQLALVVLLFCPPSLPLGPS